MLLEEGCEGLKEVNQAKERQQGQNGRATRSTLQGMHALVRAQARGEVEASQEAQFGIWLLHAQGAGTRSLDFILKAVGNH